MIVVGRLLGSADEPRFAGRRSEFLSVAWAEAGRRKLRRATDAGTDVAVDLPSGGYLADGAVLDDDGARIVVVARPAERALRVRFASTPSHADLVTRVAHVAHAFGNQHVPVDVVDGEVRVPVTTSESVALDTVRGLRLDGVEATVDDLRLGRWRPLSAGHAHG